MKRMNAMGAQHQNIRLIFILVVAAVLLATSVTAPLAQSTRVLKGTVLNSAGRPMTGFPIKIGGRADGLPQNIYILTDNRGNYSVFNLPPGRYRISPQNQPELGMDVQVTGNPVTQAPPLRLPGGN
jgi:hypothetical protein